MLLREIFANANHSSAQNLKAGTCASTKKKILADASAVAPNPMVTSMELVPLLRKAKTNRADHEYLFKTVLPRIRDTYGKDHSVKAYKTALKMLGESTGIDKITVDVPLLIRLLEYAREDAKTDMDLHHVAEKLIALSQNNHTLSMKDYESIVKKHKENN